MWPSSSGHGRKCYIDLRGGHPWNANCKCKCEGRLYCGKKFNTEAILGLDFLEQNSYTINTEQKVLHLCGKALPLQGAVHAGMPANVPQVTSASLSELLRIPPFSEIEAVAEVAKLEHTKWNFVGDRAHTNNQLQLTSNSSKCTSYPMTTQWHLYNPAKSNQPISRHSHIT